MKSKRVLLVEDNPYDEALTLKAFKNNYLIQPVAVVRDGAEALDYLFCRGSYSNRDPRDIPQLILLDLKLPKVDGLEVLKEIRNNPSTAWYPVVVLTSSKEEEDLLSCYQNGANSYVRKPVDFDKFVEVVKQLGLYWFVLNQLPDAASI